MPCRPILDKIQRSRIKKYLGYIRSFQIDQLNVKEMLLWSTLDACLGPNTLLLPNLTSLSIAYQQTNMLSYWVNIAPLLNSNIKTISLSVSSTRVAEVLVSLLQSYGVMPTHIIYCGGPAKKTAQNLLQFSSLQSLRLDFTGHPLERRSCSIPVMHVFKTLPHLTELAIDLRVYPISQLENPPLTLPKLLILHVTGDVPDFGKLLQSIRCPSLQTLELSFPQDWSSVGKALCDIILQIFPNLRHLTIETVNIRHDQVVRIGELRPLLVGLDLWSFQLINIGGNVLSPADFRFLIASWPHLHTLSIPFSDGLTFVEVRCLVPLTQSTCLYTVDLPLCFKSFTELSPSITINGSSSFVTEIQCSRYRGIPENHSGVLKVAQNLLRLFPRLKRISGRGHEDWNLFRVQEIIDTFRKLLSDHI